jgi:anti-sigma-K factor RskA
MHSTDDVDALLPAYAAAELDATERARVFQALARSAPLRHELRRYRRLFALLAAAREDIAPDATFARRLRRRFAHRGA